MKDKKIRVAVVEDDKPFRIYLETEIRKMPSCAFEYGAASLEAIQQAHLWEDYNPDILLLDMRLSNDYGGGLTVLDYFQKKKKKIPKVLIISGHCDEWMVGLMQQKGTVNGCIRKSALVTAEFTFLEGILKKTHQTDEFIVILDYQPPQMPLTTVQKDSKKLTDLQQEILIRLSKGQNQKEVAEQMHKPQNTIGNHVSLLKKKFKVETTGQLLIRTKSLGYLD